MRVVRRKARLHSIERHAAATSQQPARSTTSHPGCFPSTPRMMAGATSRTQFQLNLSDQLQCIARRSRCVSLTPLSLVLDNTSGNKQMSKTLYRFLCFAMLGVGVLPIPVGATGGANPGPTCDEITSAAICDGVPNTIVSGTHVFWTNQAAAYQVLQRLSNQELLAFLEASTSAILALIPADLAERIAHAQVAARHHQARQMVAGRERMQDFADFMSSINSPSCQDFAVWAQSYGLIIVTGASIASPLSFPGVVVGVTLAGGGLLTQHFAC